MIKQREGINDWLLVLLSFALAALLAVFVISPMSMAANSPESSSIERAAVAGELQSQTVTADVTGSYLGTVAITSPVTLGVLDLSLQLAAQGAAIEGQVSQERTLIVDGTPAVSGAIIGSVNGITPTFRIESAPFADMVSNQPVTRVFTLEGEVLEDGRVLRGIYTEELTGYLPDALVIEGIFQLSRPGVGATNFGIPLLSMQAEKRSIFINTNMTIRVSFKDESGNPVSGMGVALTTDLGTINPAKVTTNAAGEATATFSAGSTLGMANITATADDGQVTTLQVRVTPPIVISITTAAPLLPTHDGQTQVTVRVTDDKGQPIANAAVTLSSTLGSIAPTNANTNASGQVVATYSAGPQPGLAIVTVEYIGVEEAVSIQLQTPRVETVQLGVGSAQLNGGQSTSAKATVKDQFGRPLAGELVVFFATLGTVSPDSVLTNAAGEATTTVTVGSNPGQATVRAISGAHVGEATIRIVDPTALAILSITPDHGPESGGTAVTIAGQNFKSGIQVLFQDKACTNVVLTNATKLTCTTPAHPPATVNVRVKNSDGQESSLTDAFTFEKEDSGPVSFTIFLPTVQR